MKVGLFAEDDGHTALLSPLIERLAGDEGLQVTISERNSAGGAGMVLRSLRSYLLDLNAGREEFLDILVVARDGNCSGFTARHGEITKHVKALYAGSLVVAVPDPHIEVWYLADPRAPSRALGGDAVAKVPTHKCERHRYKRALREAFREVGIFPVAGGVEYGSDIAGQMDLNGACRDDRSLGRFVDDLRSALRVAGSSS